MNAEPLTEKLRSGNVRSTNAWVSELGADRDIKQLIGFARQMATMVEFATPTEAKYNKQDLNAYIRDGDEVVAEEFCKLSVG